MKKRALFVYLPLAIVVLAVSSTVFFSSESPPFSSELGIATLSPLGAGGGVVVPASEASGPEYITECSDGVDNTDPEDDPPPIGDGSELADEDDPECHTDGDATDVDRRDSYDPLIPFEDGSISECSDEEDNDEDGRIDIEDSACHTDLDANDTASDEDAGIVSYDPRRDSENDLGIEAVPSIVRSGNTSNISFYVIDEEPGMDIRNCSLTDQAGNDYLVGSRSGGQIRNGDSGVFETGPLTEESIFTLSCDIDGVATSVSDKVVVLPVFEEF